MCIYDNSVYERQSQIQTEDGMKLNVYRAGDSDSSVNQACFERGTQPYSLEGAIQFVLAQCQEVFTTP